MHSRQVWLLLGFAVLLAPGRARAIFGEEDWFSGQNALLARLLSAQLEELYKLSELIANVRLATSAANESLAIARETWRAYKTVRDYSLEELMRDAKRGLYQTWPDLREIERDGVLLREQIEKGEGLFSVWNRYDDKMHPVMNRLFEFSYQASIWPAVFPEAMRHRPNATPVEKRIWERFVKTRQDVEVLTQKTALSALARKVAALVKDAEESGRLDLEAQATAAQLAVQEVVNSTEFLNLYKSQVAIEEEARARERRARQTIRRAMVENVRKLLLPGGMNAE